MANKEADFIIQNGILLKTKGQNAVTLRKNLANRTNNTEIAPISPSKKKKKKEDEEEERTWFTKGQFDDGYQVGDIWKTILGTMTDVGENLTSGVLGMGERAVDAFASISDSMYLTQKAQSGQMVTPEDIDFAKKMREDSIEFIKKDLYNEEQIAKNIITGNVEKNWGISVEDSSVLGEKSDSLVQSAGQLGATIGLQAVGLPWYMTTGATSFGGEMENALNQGASYYEALGSSAITAGAEILTEKLSGGISFGGRTLDDITLKPLTEKIANKTVKALTNFGIDAVGEGAEEVITSVISNLGTALYKEESIEELLTSEEAMDEYIESFIGGAVLGGGSSAISSAIDSKKSNKTTFSENENKVIQAEVESRVKEAETDGKKLDNKAKKEIEKQVKQELEKGYISIDSIEKTLGGEAYTEYDNLVKESEEFETLRNTTGANMTDVMNDRLAELKAKNSEKSYKDLIAETKQKISDDVKALTGNDRFLQESYNEKARKSESFQADLTQYDTKQQAVIQKAVDSGILNNTKRTHEFVDIIAKISADKGVSFDFTNNEKLSKSKFALEGKNISGYVENGNVTLNIDSSKALNTIVGHEITHVMEGTELYTELQKAVKEYATTKGEYASRLQAIKEHYKDVDGAVAENEVTADLIGDYLFTDSDFISKLSTEKPTLFKKIYVEIKYLVKVITSGKEARQIEKVKRAFEKAYKESSNISEGTRYTLDEMSVEDKINRSMTMKEAKDMLQRVYNAVDIRGFKNADEWLQEYGSDDVAMTIESDYNLYKKYIESNEDILNEEYTLGDVLEAYISGTLVGKQKETSVRLDTSKDTGFKDERLYAPQDVKGGVELYEKANQRVTNSNREEVYKARADFIINAHNKGYIETLGLTKEEVNKKLKTWANYTQKAMNLSNSLNEGVALQNKWTGIENSTILNTIVISDEELGKLVKSIEGNSNEWQRKYITSTMLALDTHIDYKNLSFVFDGKQISEKALGEYRDSEQTIYIKVAGQNTVAHEMGHYIDHLWARDLGYKGKDGLTGRGLNLKNLTPEQAQFVKNFNTFLSGIENTSDIGSAYKQSSNEVFARFVARFTEWTKNQATNNRYGYEDKWYKDNFTESQYREFVKILQEKAMLDTTSASYSLGVGTKKYGDYNVYGSDVALETSEQLNKTSEVEPIQETTPAVEEVAPTVPEVAQTEQVVDDYAPMSEEEANRMLESEEEWERMRTLQEVDEPAEIDAPIYEPLEANNPFEERDIKEVGNRSVKAYMYENPEVKPYFQEEAQIMLGELRNSIKGERVVNAQVLYDTNGEAGVWGTTRETSEELAYLLDTFKYTYKELEKGLNAIIEDNGKENNAVSKRIEFMLDERLREGHTDFMSGYEVPPNQEYISVLAEKEISEYSDEAWNNWLRQVEEQQNAEVQETVEDVAPVDDMQVLYSLEQEQQSILDEMDNVVETEEATDVLENPTQENYNTKVENYQKAIEGYRNVRATIETSFDETIAKKTAEYEALKRKDTQRATNLLTQIENLKLRKNNNLLKVDQKIQRAEKNVDNLIHSGATRRAVLHNNLVEDMRGTFAQHGMDFDKVLENAINKGTFASVDNTPQRFMEKTLGYKEGQLLADLTVNEVAQNESKGINWLNSFTNKKDGLLRQISKQYNIKPRSKESALAQMYAEGFYVDEEGKLVEYGDKELEADVKDPQVRENIKGLAKDTRIRRIYDETLDAINDSRRRNLYEAIPKRQNYFLHFREMEDTFSKLGIPFNPNDIRLKDLPTDINGMSADLQPGQPYFASANRRKGYKTTHDLLGGLEKYLNNAKNQIYHIDDIQKLRALRNHIADTFGQAKGLESLNAMTEEEAMQRIEEVYNSHLSTFAKFLNEEANVIAGKTSLVDRGLEGVVGRRGIQFLNTVNRQVGSNMVGFNISSSMTNLISVTQALAKSNKTDFVKAFAQTVSNRVSSVFGKDDGFRQVNPIFARRNGIEKFSNTLWDKATDKGYIFMSAVDNISTEIIARTKYNEFVKQGMSEQKAHIEADKWASRLLGDRSLGQQPQVFNSKMLGMFTKFQLEVRNQLDSQFYDTIQEAKVSNEDIENALVRNAKTSAKITSTFVQLAVAQHLFGMAFESIAGYNPAFDIISTLVKLFGFDDDEESEDTVLDNVEQGFLELLGDLPYTSMVTSGGRIPISSALPIKQFITGEDSYGGEKSRLDTLKESAPYFLLPTGYGQVKKTVQGLSMFDDDLPISGSYTKSGNLRFAVEDTWQNKLQAGIFGQYASEEASDYFDNERQTLKKNQIQELVDLDMPIQEYWKYREGLNKQDTLEEKFDYIAGLDLPVKSKNIMINNIVDRKEKVDMSNYDDFGSYEEFDFYTKNQQKYEFLEANGVSYKEYKSSEKAKEKYDSAYEWYKNYPEKVTLSKAVTNNVVEYRSYTSALNEIRADKDSNGKSISGSAKAKKLDYINSLDLEYGAKLILFKSEYNADDTYNYEIIDYLNNRDDITWDEEVLILQQLGFNVTSDGTISW